MDLTRCLLWRCDGDHKKHAPATWALWKNLVHGLPDVVFALRQETWTVPIVFGQVSVARKSKQMAANNNTALEKMTEY